MNEENRKGLIVALPCYFAVLLVVAFLSNRWLRHLEKTEKSDAITGHYLRVSGLLKQMFMRFCI